MQTQYSNLQKARIGFKRLKDRVNEIASTQLLPLAVDSFGGLYAKSRLAQSNITPEQKVLYSFILAATTIDAGSRLITGYGIETYLKAGLEKVRSLFTPVKELV